MSQRERELIRDLIKLSDYTENDLHIEVGTKDGDSLIEAMKGNDKFHAISVDPILTKTCRRAFSGNNRVEFISKLSDKAYNKLAKKDVKASSIYIDGDHSYKWAKHDIINYWKLWNKKGFFAGHDYTKRGRKRYGVIPAVNEFFELDYPWRINMRFPCKNGILHVFEKVWFYIEKKQMSKYREFLKNL